MEVIFSVMAIEDLEATVRERVLELLAKPYAGTKAFPMNHPDAAYKSNCHGAMAYVFGLDDATHPGEISMRELIDRDFERTDEPKIGDLVAFYKGPGDTEDLLHSALIIEEGRIFQQAGGGGIFETSTVQARKNILSATFGDIRIKYYRHRNHS